MILALVKRTHDIIIKKCKNCGKYFISENRISSVYCNRIFENNKTCREVGAINAYNEKLKKDEVNLLYRRTLSAKKMLANRNPDIPIYLEKYEKWKKEANKFKQDVKNGRLLSKLEREGKIEEYNELENKVLEKAKARQEEFEKIVFKEERENIKTKAGESIYLDLVDTMFSFFANAFVEKRISQMSTLTTNLRKISGK